MNRRRFIQCAMLGLAPVFRSRAAHPAHGNLLQYPDTAGAWHPVRTTEDWTQRREAILRAAEQMMGPLPGAEKRCPVDLRIEEEVDAGSYVRRAITYASEPGGRVPAYLLIPKRLLTGSPSPAPGILCLHPTDSVIGRKVVVGLGGKANRQYAAELAERGFVTLAPAYPQLADYQPDLSGLGYVSGTMKAIWDNIRGLDLLESLPFVRRGSFGAIGHSLGGHNAVFTAVFDPRIKAIVSSCGLDSFSDYYGGNPANWVVGRGWCQPRYMPRLAEYAGRLSSIPFDFDDLLAALAPRRVFISAPRQDTNFQWASVDRLVASAREVFALHGAAEALSVVHPDCPHDFPDEVRAAAYATLEQALVI